MEKTKKKKKKKKKKKNVLCTNSFVKHLICNTNSVS